MNYIAVFLIICLFIVGCGNPQQKQAYEEAAKLENSPYMDTSYLTVQKYREVIRMNPSSNWAEKAQSRIDAIQNKQNDKKAIRENRLNRILDID